MHFYSQTNDEVMRLPIKTFWLMHANIDRIKAQEDMRSLTVSIGAQAGGEAVKSIRQQLIVEAGTIVKAAPADPLDAQRDEKGFAELKALSGL